MRIAVIANLKKNAPTWDGMPEDQWDDLDSETTINSIVAALESGGHEATFFEGSILPLFNLVENLEKYRPDMCFNICEGHFGDSRESQIPAVLEMLRLPYTGSKVLTLSLALDKPMTKRILYYHGLPTPEFQTFERADEPIDEDLLDEAGELRYPVFLKPSREGTSVGVTPESIVHTVEQLRTQLDKQLRRYNQTILCERYVAGREVTVGVIGNFGPRAARRLNERALDEPAPSTLFCLPPLEVDLGAYDASESGIYTNRIKVELADTFYYFCPAPLPPEFIHKLNLLAVGVFRVIACRDVARIDFRLDKDNDNKPYILEVNPLPGLTPGYSDLCLEANAAGWSYERLINTIVDLAAVRQGLKDTSIEAVLAG